MAFIPTPQGIHVEIEYVIGGRQMYNIFTIDANMTVDDSAIDEAAGVVAGWAQTTLVAVLSEDAAIASVLAKGMASVETHQAIVTSGFPANGSVASPVLPANVAACISFRTELTGRSARGRVYMPGIPENAVVGSFWAAGVAGNFTTVWGSLKTTLAGTFTGGGLAITSFVSGGVPRTEGRQLLVTTVSVDSRVDSQRRRLG